MRGKELLRLVWLNITQNKFKVIMTSIGIIVGAATIVMVIAIGKGGQADVADQFKNLNAGAIDISYDGGTENERSGSESGAGSAPGGGMAMGQAVSAGGFGGSRMGEGNFSGGGSTLEDFSGGRESGSASSGGSERPSGENMPDMSGKMSGGMNMFFGNSTDMEERMNQENITLTVEDADDISMFASGVGETTISYSTKSTVDGGELEEATTYTIAGVKENYATISNLTLSVGEFITESNDENKEKVCILGAQAAEEIFGSAIEAYGSVIYIDDREYVVNGVLATMGTVASGISPDEAIFIPYETGIKYIVGTEADPTITVIAEDVNNIDGVMEAASASNEILTMLLVAMAAIVFVVGGIGIMNVLFVSVKERTNEIGILKAIGCSQKNILFEFLLEAAAISCIGGVLGIGVSFIVAPIAEYFGVRVEMSVSGLVVALLFAIGTGTIFGFYPAYKASKLVPIEALGAD